MTTRLAIVLTFTEDTISSTVNNKRMKSAGTDVEAKSLPLSVRAQEAGTSNKMKIYPSFTDRFSYENRTRFPIG